MIKLSALAARAIAFIGLTVTGMNAAWAEEPIVLKLHHLMSPASSTHKNMIQPWADKVTKESGGRLRVDVYPAMQLGGTPQQLADQARDGVVDIVWTLPGYTPGRFTKTEVFELPFMHTSTKATNKALTAFAANHGEEFKDYKVIALHVHGGQVFHSHVPIRTVDDLKGLKIRTPSRTGGWMIEAFGATPIGAPLPQIPELLSKRIVDAVMIPLEVTIGLKSNELVDYHTTLDDPKFTRVSTASFAFLMNKAKYDALPNDLKKLIDDNSGMNIADWLGQVWDDAETVGAEDAAKTGELIKMAPAEVSKLRAMTEQPVTDRWTQEMKEKGVDGQALVNEARSLLAKYSE